MTEKRLFQALEPFQSLSLTERKDDMVNIQIVGMDTPLMTHTGDVILSMAQRKGKTLILMDCAGHHCERDVPGGQWCPSGAVDLLQKSERTELGFIPLMSIRHQIKRSRAVLAGMENEGVVGYLFWGATLRKKRIRIEQICVAKEHRRKGIGICLVAAMFQQMQHEFTEKQIDHLSIRCRLKNEGGIAFWDKVASVGSRVETQIEPNPNNQDGDKIKKYEIYIA
jgi:ribosomal protein S18 acetylase RimI-like enzyme